MTYETKSVRRSIVASDGCRLRHDVVSPFVKNEKISIALLYALVILVVYAHVVFLGKTLLPSLYYPHGVTESAHVEYGGRETANTFNIDLATPAYEVLPTNRAVGDIYRQWQLPLWNPYQAAGTPLAAQYSTRAFFPYQIVEDICPYWTWDYFLLGRLWFAAFFTFLFLRALSLRRSSAFLGGILYMLSGSLIWFISLEQMANVAMMVPALLFCLERLIRTKRNLYVALSAIAFGLVLLAGQPEVALYVLALAAAYFAFRVLTDREERLLMPRHFFKFALAFILGLGLASPLLLPFAELMRNSYTAHPLGGTMGVRDPTPLPWAIYLLMPTLSQVPTYFRDLPHNGIWDYLGGYSGVLVVFLAILGLYTANGRWKYSLFFSLFGAVILAKNFGFILVKWIGYLPLFDQVWSDRWAGPAWTFCFAVAAAIGIEALRGHVGGVRAESEVERHGNRPSAKQLGVIGALLVLGGILFGLFTLGPCGDSLSLRWLLLMAASQGICLGVGTTFLIASLMPGRPNDSRFVYLVTIASSLMFVLMLCFMTLSQTAVWHTYVRETPLPLRWDGILVAVAVIVIATVLVLSLNGNRRRGSQYAILALAVISLWFYIPKGYGETWQYISLVPFAIGLLLVAVLAGQKWRWSCATAILFVVSTILVDVQAPQGFANRQDPFTEEPYVAFLKEQQGYYRVMGGEGILMPNFASATGMYDLRYINSMSVEWYQFYVENSLVKQHYLAPTDRLWFTGKPYVTYQVERSIYQEIREHLPSYSLLGVKYILAPSSLDVNALDESGIEDSTHFPLVYDGEIRIYENPNALPRAFIAHEVEYASSYEAAQEATEQPGFDLRNTVILEEEAPAWYSSPPPTDSSEAHIKVYEPNRVVVDARLENPGVLVLSDIYYPGWRAYVDDGPARIYRVDGLIRGVFLESGEHTVVFSYFPRSFSIGLALAGVSAFLCLALLLWDMRRRGSLQ